ncbi:MAG: acyl-CoA thioesterase [Cyclobacteriaceae bacterium]
MEKLLTSEVTIRFQDCDPFNHLNNARYLDYFINAREDQIIAAYQLDVFKLAATKGKSWVISSNQIAYFRPAQVMEKVSIETRLIDFTEKRLLVEMQMWDKDQSDMKALLWAGFTHFDLKNLIPISQLSEFGELFGQVVSPVAEKTFEKRVKNVERKKIEDSV